MQLPEQKEALEENRPAKLLGLVRCRDLSHGAFRDLMEERKSEDSSQHSQESDGEWKTLKDKCSSVEVGEQQQEDHGGF